MEEDYGREKSRWGSAPEKVDGVSISVRGGNGRLISGKRSGGSTVSRSKYLSL